MIYQYQNKPIFCNTVNDAQKLRMKKPRRASRDQHAALDYDQLQRQQETTDDTNTSSNEIQSRYNSSSQNNTSERRNHQSSSIKRNVSFADEVNVRNDDGNAELQSPIISNEPIIEENLPPSSLVNSSPLNIPTQDPTEEKFTDSDYHSLSPTSFHQQQYDRPSQSKYNLPSKYRLPLASKVLINKMDPNLRMLIIKELSKNGHVERPLSRMSKFQMILFISFLNIFYFRFNSW
jgi:hypothetical protein